jgi:hypothetical protein
LHFAFFNLTERPCHELAFSERVELAEPVEGAPIRMPQLGHVAHLAACKNLQIPRRISEGGHLGQVGHAFLHFYPPSYLRGVGDLLF